MKHVVERGVSIPIPQSYSDCLKLADSDYYRWHGKSSGNIIKLWLARWRNPAIGFMFYFRLCSYRSWLYPYFRLRYEKYLRKYGLQIPLAAKVGYGLYLGHGIGIAVNGTAVIGNNVNLSQFTTIGSVKSKAAVIEDDCYIGPSVCLVEDIRIGKGSMVGAGAVVVGNVPAKTTVAGVPAKIIKEDISYIPANRYKL